MFDTYFSSLFYVLAVNVAFFVIVAGVLLYVGKGEVNVEKYSDSYQLEDSRIQQKIKAKLLLKEKANNKSSNTQPLGKNKYGLPQGQIPSNSWIVLDLGKRPKKEQYNLEDNGRFWSLKVIIGDSKCEVKITLADIESYGLVDYPNSSWHCVTGWSKTNLLFRGLPFQSFEKLVSAKCESSGYQYNDNWRFMFQISPEGYTVPVFREDTCDAFLCVYADSKLMEFEHGGIRFVFPQLFGWKSCKWISEVRLSEKYEKGFWERIGCHPRGRIEFDERWAPKASLTWKFLSAANRTFIRVFGQTIGTRVMQQSGYILGLAVDAFKFTFKLKND